MSLIENKAQQGDKEKIKAQKHLYDLITGKRYCFHCECLLTEIEADTQKDVEGEWLTCSSCCYKLYK